MAKVPENPTPGQIWGRALRRTPEEIVRQSIITADDIASAQKHWEKNAPPKLKGIVTAKATRKKKT